MHCRTRTGPFDNPNLLVCCIVGDGEAETGPLATSWHSNKFLNPVSDGAVLPILHLNGYKIANPTVLARIGDDELTSLLEGYGYEVNGSRRRPSQDAPVDGRHPGQGGRANYLHPALRTRKWTCDKTEVAHDRAPVAEGSDPPPNGGRAAVRGYVAVAPGAVCRGTHQPRALGTARIVDAQLPTGRVVRREGRPGGRIGGPPAQEPPPHERQPAFQRRVLLQDLELPDFRDYAVPVAKPGTTYAEATRSARSCGRHDG